MQPETTNPTPRRPRKQQPEPLYIATLEQYEAERAAVLQQCPILNPETFIYAPGNCEYSPEVQEHLRKLYRAAFGQERIEAFTRRFAQLVGAGDYEGEASSED
jgi:hypothetical protein